MGLVHLRRLLTNQSSIHVLEQRNLAAKSRTIRPPPLGAPDDGDLSACVYVVRVRISHGVRHNCCRFQFSTRIPYGKIMYDGYLKVKYGMAHRQQDKKFYNKIKMKLRNTTINRTNKLSH